MVEYAIVHYAKRLIENREHRKKKDTEAVSNLTGYIQRLYLENGRDGFEKLFRQPEKIMCVVRWVPKLLAITWRLIFTSSIKIDLTLTDFKAC